jgi:hypothetical protein
MSPKHDDLGSWPRGPWFQQARKCHPGSQFEVLPRQPVQHGIISEMNTFISMNHAWMNETNARTSEMKAFINVNHPFMSEMNAFISAEPLRILGRRRTGT